ncbi:hypothetical protein MSLAZ_2314 [Methanosarcina lacustris Z-7289]|uniref:Uncharacterized protein n=1 Tax=Methanosarcina lacustris Z-7289 TaxID=1434111 RepID=A0A0E3WU23_9EURY|nr:hypothetical protein [Methanosarcina lacustris]AKB75575.1 hypothetical protein MSLAZ_2314 [Methanosarcina lacustris Z-7289]
MERRFDEYSMPEYYSGQGNPQWGSEEVDLPNITNAEDLENLNVYIIAQKNNGNSDNKYLQIDDLVFWAPES